MLHCSTSRSQFQQVLLLSSATLALAQTYRQQDMHAHQQRVFDARGIRPVQGCHAAPQQAHGPQPGQSSLTQHLRLPAAQQGVGGGGRQCARLVQQRGSARRAVWHQHLGGKVAFWCDGRSATCCFSSCGRRTIEQHSLGRVCNSPGQTQKPGR